MKVNSTRTFVSLGVGSIAGYFIYLDKAKTVFIASAAVPASSTSSDMVARIRPDLITHTVLRV